MKLKPTMNQPKFKVLLSFTELILHDLEENIKGKVDEFSFDIRPDELSANLRWVQIRNRNVNTKWFFAPNSILFNKTPGWRR